MGVVNGGCFHGRAINARSYGPGDVGGGADWPDGADGRALCGDFDPRFVQRAAFVFKPGAASTSSTASTVATASTSFSAFRSSSGKNIIPDLVRVSCDVS